MSDIIHKSVEYPQWTIEVGQPGDSKTVAEITGVPPPRIGDMITHEDINGPMTVVAVIWHVGRWWCPYTAEVFVR